MCKKQEYERNLTKNFFRLPNEVFNQNLSSAEFLVFSYLVSCAPRFNPSTRHISNATGLSKPTVLKAIAGLEKRGLIQRTTRERANQKPIYGIIPPTKWPMIRMVKVIDHTGQDICPVLDKSFDHIQDEQDLKSRLASRQPNERSVLFEDLLRLITDKIASKEHFNIPSVVAGWLESHQPDFDAESLMTAIRPKFSGPRGAKIFEEIRSAAINAFDLATAEKARSQNALVNFLNDRQLSNQNKESV